MIIYTDTEKELFISDYTPISVSLKAETITSLRELLDNLEKAQENAWIYGSDLLLMAISGDIKKVEMYIKMKTLQAKKQGKA